MKAFICVGIAIIGTLLIISWYICPHSPRTTKEWSCHRS